MVSKVSRASSYLPTYGTDRTAVHCRRAFRRNGRSRSSRFRRLERESESFASLTAPQERPLHGAYIYISSSIQQDYARLLRESGDFSDLELDLDEDAGDDSSENEFSGIRSDESSDEDGQLGLQDGESESGEDGEFDGFEGIADDLDVESGEDEGMRDGGEDVEDDDEEDDSDEEEDSEGDSEDFESEFDGSELSFNEGDEEDESGAMTMTFGGEEPAAAPAPSAAPQCTTDRYVPPHLRNKETVAVASSTAPPSTSATSKPSDSLEAPPEDPRLRRLLNGHLNKLSPQNISTINDALLSLYASHPRAIVSSVLKQLLLGIVSDRDNLGDQLMITYACLVAALFRTIGIEFPAGVLTRSINLLDQSLAKSDAATAKDLKDEEGGFEGKPGSKQAQNLVAFLSELYNFGVIGCGVVYDLVRLFVERDRKSVV